jgi:hypothetical protein
MEQWNAVRKGSSYSPMYNKIGTKVCTSIDLPSLPRDGSGDKSDIVENY